MARLGPKSIGLVVRVRPGLLPFTLTRVLRTLVPGQWREHHRNPAPNQLGRSVKMSIWHEFLGKLLNLLKSEFLVRHFAPAESERHFDLHLFAKEVDGVGQLHTEIMRIDLRAQLDLFNLVGVLVFARLFVLLGLLVTVLAKINESA